MYQSLVKYASSKRSVRRSRLLCYLIFGFLPHPKNRMSLWDNTSLLLKKSLKKWVQNNETVLEIGTGDVGLLSNYLVRIQDVSITAADICKEFIENARMNNNRNDRINFCQSDLFKGLDPEEKYDVIFSNPPYVKTEDVSVDDHKDYHGFKEDFMAIYASDGGPDGMQIIEHIISQSGKYLEENGSLIIGFNRKHIDEEKLHHNIDKSGYYITEQLNSKITTCQTLRLKYKAKA